MNASIIALELFVCIISYSSLISSSQQLPFNCDGCGDKFTRKKLLTDHFSTCQAHLLNRMQQQEKLQTAIVDANGQTLLLQAEQNQMPASIMQHPGSTTLLLQHAALIQQPNSHVEARLHPHQTQQHHQNSLELQPVS